MNRLTLLLISSIWLLLIIPVQAQMGPTADAMGPPPEPTSDLVPDAIQTYKTVDGNELKIHIFYPDDHEANSQHPALLFFHGGGFRRGSPIQGYEMSEIFNPQGVAVISVQYRLAEQAGTLDHIIADAKSSVRFVRSHATELGIDPERIAASGHSAGGYLAYAAGAIDIFDEPDENLEISSLANAMIPWSMGAQRRVDDLPEGKSLNDFQPAAYVKTGMAPSIFITGGADDSVPLEPLQQLQESITAQGNISSVHVVDGAEHLFREPGQKEEVYATILSFLDSLGYIDK